MKTVEEWKTVILEYCRKDYVSFAEIVRQLDGAAGDWVIELAEHPNVLLWSGLCEELTHALIELKNENKIHYEPAHPLVYLADGMALNLPTATGKGIKRGYKKPHWARVCIRLGPPDQKRIKAGTFPLV